MNQKLALIAQKYHDEIVKTASELIQINSQSTQEGEVAEYTLKKMQQLGYDQVIRDRYGNVFGVMKGTGGGSSVTLNCHLDVVYESDAQKWPYPPFSGAVAEGKIWGRGASDTKGTFAIQLYVPKMLKEAGLVPKGDLIVSGVVCEEIAGFGAMMQAKDDFMLTDYVIIGEASENDLAISCRGRLCLVVTIKGKSCHASVPHQGKNPFDVLGPLLCELKNVQPAYDEKHGYSTMTATKVVSSEVSTNIVPNQITLCIDYRQLPGETTQSVVDKIRAAADKVAVDGMEVVVEPFYFPLTTYTGYQGMALQGEYPFGVDADEEYVLFCKNTLEAAVGRTIETKPWHFATDTGHFSAKGCKCIGYSPAELRYCHTTEDNIDIEMMKEAEVGYMALAYALCNRDK